MSKSNIISRIRNDFGTNNNSLSDNVTGEVKGYIREITDYILGRRYESKAGKDARKRKSKGEFLDFDKEGGSAHECTFVRIEDKKSYLERLGEEKFSQIMLVTFISEDKELIKNAIFNAINYAKNELHWSEDKINEKIWMNIMRGFLMGLSEQKLIIALNNSNDSHLVRIEKQFDGKRIIDFYLGILILNIMIEKGYLKIEQLSEKLKVIAEKYSNIRDTEDVVLVILEELKM